MTRLKFLFSLFGVPAAAALPVPKPRRPERKTVTKQVTCMLLSPGLFKIHQQALKEGKHSDFAKCEIMEHPHMINGWCVVLLNSPDEVRELRKRLKALL